ncbi:PepSY domain-containing protein [Nocardia sp. NPDC058499]|uniref:PepSY domain-containing protein n=1 Tax=Nocardia sp. NPDC058499 TaxID=3346530 RepID=UPI00365CFE62
MSNSPRRKRRHIAYSVIAGVLIAVSAGCADSDDDGADAAGTPPAPAATSAAPAGAGIDALNRAGETATGAVPDSTLISIETERDGRWEVQVVTPDGTEHEMDISGDGATVTMGPTSKNEDEDDKTKHRDRIQAARLDYRAAADAVLTEVPNGTITELNIDGNNGTTVWEADVIDSSQTKREVTVDAGSGEILHNTAGR